MESSTAMTLDFNITGGFESKKKLSSLLAKSPTQKLHNSGRHLKILKKHPQTSIRNTELAPMGITYNYNTKPRKSVGEHKYN